MKEFEGKVSEQKVAEVKLSERSRRTQNWEQENAAGHEDKLPYLSTIAPLTHVLLLVVHDAPKVSDPPC